MGKPALSWGLVFREWSINADKMPFLILSVLFVIVLVIEIMNYEYFQSFSREYNRTLFHPHRGAPRAHDNS